MENGKTNETVVLDTSPPTHLEILETSPATDVACQLVRHVRSALEQVVTTDATKLAPEVLTMWGMSGRKYRCFINSLVEKTPAPRYLEIGSFTGSSLCSAIFGNNVDAVAIDNWSQLTDWAEGGSSHQFLANLARFKGAARVSFLERDCREVDYQDLARILGSFNVYFYDGPHSTEEQYDGVARVQPALTPSYVQIVDDWNWDWVRQGTLSAMTDLGLRIEFMAQLRTTLDGTSAPPPLYEKSDWHNGYCIAVVSRPS